jgi:ABC-type sugar transport system substrate-binding protein
MKKMIGVFVILCAITGFSMAGGGSEDTVDKSKIVMRGTDTTMRAVDFDVNVKPNRRYTIAIVVKNAALPVWESHLIAARKAGEKLGVEVLTYAPTKADNVEEQKRILEDLVTTGVDAVVLAPANTEAVRGPVLDLIKAKIPVVYDNTMGPSDVDYLSYIGVDNVEAGKIIGETITQMMGGQGSLVVMEGVPGQSTSDLRVQGMMEYLSKAHPNMRVERVVTNWEFGRGRQVAEDYITKWGNDLKGMAAVGGNQAEGAAEAVKAATMNVVINGFDVQEPQYAAVENGGEAFTISQGVYEQAYYGVVAAIKALNGESVPRWIQTPIRVVTKENIKQLDERPDALRARP